MWSGKLKLLLAGAIIMGVACVATPSAEASEQKAQGITVSPAFSQVAVQSSETKHPLEVRITNNRSVTQKLRLGGADFNSLEDSGGLLFVGTNPTQLEKKYGLAKWLDLPETTINIEPQQTATVHASILNQADLAPGGHYGALMLSLDDGSGGNQKNKVSLHPIASSLLFVTKVGGDTHRLSLDKVDAEHSVIRLPTSVVLHFRNFGNTHVVPRGTVLITDLHGKLVSKGVINTDSDLILPERSRLYEVQLQSFKTPKWPGHYNLTVNYRFDGYDTFRTYQTKLTLLTPLSLLTILIGISALLGAAFYFDPFKLINKRHHKT